ncbi:cellulose biosynthesis protein BcsN [Rhizobium paknamense]|uniref:Cellulose biosynthesis protein BcsN n=1 Tax=Rhizobium paknamense TaxID=1206817 RepID=A0ABU0IG06_9HYPH|nr:cellulose biosynthesis protein BcsN [Rhizobium paknamense]MDQ0457076.1 hypothetical protein [Rhizobium paknamense]
MTQTIPAKIVKAGLTGLVLLTGLSLVWEAQAADRVAMISPAKTRASLVKPGAPRLEMAHLAAVKAPVVNYASHVEPKAAFQTLYYASSAKGKLPANSLTLEIGLEDSPRYRQPAAYEDASKDVKGLFPGVKMVVEPTIRQNSYGQYGVATGRLGKNGACVYAWQAIRDPNPFKQVTTVGFETQKNNDLNLPVRVTLRYCDPAATPEQLARLMSTLSIRQIDSPSLDLLR